MPDEVEKQARSDQEHSVSSSTTGLPGSNTLNGAGTSEGGLEGVYMENPESSVDRVYEKDKDPEIHQGRSNPEDKPDCRD